MSSYEALDHTVRKLSSRFVCVSCFGAILTKLLCHKILKSVIKKNKLLQLLAQNLGQNRPKPLKSKRSRRELSNGVVESLIRRDLTPVMVRRAGRPAGEEDAHGERYCERAGAAGTMNTRLHLAQHVHRWINSSLPRSNASERCASCCSWSACRRPAGRLPRGCLFHAPEPRMHAPSSPEGWK